MRYFAVRLAGFLAALALLNAPAQPLGRQIMIFNRGAEPIFRVQIGHKQSDAWSDDLLAFDDVIDVGEGASVTIALTRQCIYDVRALYRDRDAAALDNVDLCTASSLSFEH